MFLKYLHLISTKKGCSILIFSVKLNDFLAYLQISLLAHDLHSAVKINH